MERSFFSNVFALKISIFICWKLIRAIHFTTYFICTLSAKKEGPLDLLV